jgi:microcystin degradation protein MlrC
MRKRVLLAELSHETHTFVGGQTAPDDFAPRRGPEMLPDAGDASILAGVAAVARERSWEIVPAIAMGAAPGPTAVDEVLEHFWDAFSQSARQAVREGVDGIYLNLHGAMVCPAFPDVEGELLRRIRDIEGLAGVPVGGVLDLHGNFTPAMARHSDALVAYRENPHTDAQAAAMDAARLLDRLMV